MTCCTNGHLTIVTPPSVEPVTLDDALEHCHANSGVEDNWFNRIIKAARIEAESFQRRAYIEQTLQLSFDQVPNFPIYLPRPPLIDVTGISVFDMENVETALTLTDFLIDTDSQPGRIMANYDFSYPGISNREMKSMVITYKAGYGSDASTVPDDVKNAMLFYIGYLYDHRAGELSYRFNVRESEFRREPKQFYDLLAKQRIYL